MVCDSTTAMVWGEPGSEGEVREQLQKLISGLQNRVAVACFASNVARLQTVLQVAEASGRRLCLLRRPHHRIARRPRERAHPLGTRPFVLHVSARGRVRKN